MDTLEPADTVELRRRIVAAGMEAFRAQGHGSVRVDDIARRADLDVKVVRSLFPSWDLLVVAIMNGWAGSRRRDAVHVAETLGARAYLRVLLEAAAADPALSRTRLALIGAASDPHHPAHGWYRTQYAQFVQDVTLFFTRDIIAKREPRTLTPHHAAEQLIALYEGLQLQSTMIDSIDLPAAWDRATTALAAGWSTAPR